MLKWNLTSLNTIITFSKTWYSKRLRLVELKILSLKLVIGSLITTYYRINIITGLNCRKHWSIFHSGVVKGPTI
jgi:hypothetical protein